MFGYSQNQAKTFLPIIQIITLCTTPIFSMILMKTGVKLAAILVALFFSLGAFIGILMLPYQPTNLFYVYNIIIALFYSLYNSCIWSCIALSLPSRAVSLGFGLTTVGQMTSMSIFSAFKGYLATDRTPAAYRNTIYFQVILNIVSIGILAIANWVDWRGGKMLNLPENSKRAMKLKEELDKRFD